MNWEIAAIVTICFFSEAGGCYAQRPASDVFRSDSRIVEIQIVARDQKSGLPVRDLQADELSVSENGKKQRIEYFTVLDAKSGGQTKVEATQEAGGTIHKNRAGQSSEEVAAGVTAILIDGFNSSFEDQFYATRGTLEVLARSNPRTRFGLYHLGPDGLKVLHDYSEGRKTLMDRLAGRHSFAGFDRIVEGHSGNEQQSTTSVVRGEAAVEMARVRLRTTVSALRSVTQHLQGTPGRKSLVWFSGGFSINTVLANPDLWKPAMQELVNSNVAVYAIDSAGVRTLDGFRAERPTQRDVVTRIGKSPEGSTDVLKLVAEQTGGLAFIRSNKLAGQLERALADPEVLYTIGYRPTHDKWDGRFIPVRVNIKRANVQLRYRRGYYARATERMSPTDLNAVMDDIMRSPVDATAVGIRASLSRAQETGPASLLVVIEPDSLTLNASGAILDVRYRQVGANGATLEDFTDEITLTLNDAQRKQTQENGIAWAREIYLRQGGATIQIGVCDRLSARVGRLTIRIRR